MAATISLNIPSAELTTKPGRLARLFGAQPKPLGHERVVGSTLGIIEQLIAALKTQGISNIISLRVDMSLLYEDQQGEKNDLQHLEAKLAENASRLSQEFQMIQLALEHHDQGLHYVVDLTIQGEVATGDEELSVGIAARPMALEHRPGMNAAELRDRVTAYVVNDSALREDWQTFNDFVEQKAASLATQLAGSQPIISDREIGVTMPSRSSLSHAVSRPMGEHQITFRRRGYSPDSRHYYWDPYSHCHVNPYSTLVNAFLLHTLRQGAPSSMPSETTIYDAEGARLCPLAKLDTIHLDDALLQELQTDDLLAALDAGTPPPGSLTASLVAAQEAEETARVGLIAARGRRARAGSRGGSTGTSCRTSCADCPA